jgi:hypothetical protein
MAARREWIRQERDRLDAALVREGWFAVAVFGTMAVSSAVFVIALFLS